MMFYQYHMVGILFYIQRIIIFLGNLPPKKRPTSKLADTGPIKKYMLGLIHM